MDAIASLLTSLTIVYTTVYSDADQSKHQSSALLAFVWGIHRDRWIPRTKGQLRGKCFHLMTSSCMVVACSRWHPHNAQDFHYDVLILSAGSMQDKQIDENKFEWMIHYIYNSANNYMGQNGHNIAENAFKLICLATFSNAYAWMKMDASPFIPIEIYSTKWLSWQLMSWRRKEPGHQQPWYWPS